MKSILQHILCAVLYGLLAIGIGYASKVAVKPYFQVSLPDICQTWNDKHVMEISLFITGFMLYVVVAIGKRMYKHANAMKMQKGANVLKEEYQEKPMMMTEDQLKPVKQENEDKIGPQMLQRIKDDWGEDRVYDLFEQVEAHLQRVPKKNMCVMTEQVKDLLFTDKRFNHDLVRKYDYVRGRPVSRNMRATISYIVNNYKPGIVGRDCRLTTRPQRPQTPE